MTKLFLQRIRLSVKSLWSLLLQTLGFNQPAAILVALPMNGGTKASELLEFWDVLPYASAYGMMLLKDKNYFRTLKDYPVLREFIFQQCKMEMLSTTSFLLLDLKYLGSDVYVTLHTQERRYGPLVRVKSSPPKKRKPSSSKRSSATPRKLTSHRQGRTLKP